MRTAQEEVEEKEGKEKDEEAADEKQHERGDNEDNVEDEDQEAEELFISVCGLCGETRVSNADFTGVEFWCALVGATCNESDAHGGGEGGEEGQEGGGPHSGLQLRQVWVLDDEEKQALVDQYGIMGLTEEQEARARDRAERLLREGRTPVQRALGKCSVADRGRLLAHIDQKAFESAKRSVRSGAKGQRRYLEGQVVTERGERKVVTRQAETKEMVAATSQSICIIGYFHGRQGLGLKTASKPERERRSLSRRERTMARSGDGRKKLSRPLSLKEGEALTKRGVVKQS